MLHNLLASKWDKDELKSNIVFIIDVIFDAVSEEELFDDLNHVEMWLDI